MCVCTYVCDSLPKCVANTNTGLPGLVNLLARHWPPSFLPLASLLHSVPSFLTSLVFLQFLVLLSKEEKQNHIPLRVKDI